jgi:hypothetical protein
VRRVSAQQAVRGLYCALCLHSGLPAGAQPTEPLFSCRYAENRWKYHGRRVLFCALTCINVLLMCLMAILLVNRVQAWRRQMEEINHNTDV